MKVQTSVGILFFAAMLLVRNAIGAITVPDEIREYISTATRLEDGSLSSNGGALAGFEKYLRANWREVMGNIETVAPAEKGKYVVVVGCEALTDEEYLSFLDKLANLFARGRISRDVVEQAVMPSMAREGFLAENWRKPAVRSLLDKLHARIPKDDAEQQFIRDVLSGTAKRQWNDYNGVIDSKTLGAALVLFLALAVIVMIVFRLFVKSRKKLTC